jgi:hypothetical protein
MEVPGDIYSRREETSEGEDLMNSRNKGLVPLALAFGVIGLMMVPAAAFGHAHPLGGTPIRIPLVIAFTPTTGSNPAGETHAGPLSGPSASTNAANGAVCGSPGGQASCAVTINSPDNPEAPGPTKGVAAARIDTCPVAASAASGSLPALSPCAAPDVRIGSKGTDERCGPTGTPCDTVNPNSNGANDYTGSLLGLATIRIVDHDNSPVVSAVVVDLPFSAPQFQGGQTGTPTAMPCQGTPTDASIGSTCVADTTVNTFTSILLGAPAVKAAKLANVETQTINVLDTTNAPVATQGIFIP